MPTKFNSSYRLLIGCAVAILLASATTPQPLMEKKNATIVPTPTVFSSPLPSPTNPTIPTPAKTETPPPELPSLQEIAQKLYEQKFISTEKGSFISFPSYEQQIAKRGYFAWQESGYMPRNFIVRTNVSWDSASRNADWNLSGVGFVFRENEGKNYYAAFLLLNGYVDIFRVEDGVASLKRLAHKRYGRLELPQGNATLMLVVEEPHILFFVNQKLVAKVSDDSLLNEKFRSGRLNYAIASGTNKDYGLRVRMDQVDGWTIGDEKLPTPTPTSPSQKPTPTPDALTAQGIQAFNEGKYQEAVALLSQAIEGSTNYSLPQGYLYRARAQSEVGNYTAALNDFSKVLQLNPDEVWAYRGRAAIYVQQGNYQKALEDYQQVLQRVSDRATDYNNRCWIYAQLREYEKAMADCNQALTLNPKEAEFLDTRASLYLAIGEKEKAKADLEAILRLNPNKALRNRVLETLKQLK